MTTIRLLDARRGLNRKCEELFGNAKIAEAIYRFLCDGIEECEDAESEQKRGKWTLGKNMPDYPRVPYLPTAFYCSECRTEAYWDTEFGQQLFDWCPYCGSYNGEESDNG